MLTVSIKENNPTVEEAMANFEIAVENAKKLAENVLKVVHGYGSHGVGGAILLELKKRLPQMKRKKIIKDYISGIDWCFANKTAFNYITNFPDCALDEDLNTGNIGITIIIL